MERPSVYMRPSVTRDGDKWCALYGDNIQEGVCGFGDTPAAACEDFDLAWHGLASVAGVSGGRDDTGLWPVEEFVKSIVSQVAPFCRWDVYSVGPSTPSSDVPASVSGAGPYLCWVYGNGPTRAHVKFHADVVGGEWRWMVTSIDIPHGWRQRVTPERGVPPVEK